MPKSERDMKREDEMNDDNELDALRTAALKSMHRMKADNSRDAKADTKSHIHDSHVSHHKSDQKRTHFYSKNGTNRSNLIVLTQSESELSSNRSAIECNPNNNSTQQLNANKRVLPGRFSRLERDSDTDEHSDDDNDGLLSAFHTTSVANDCHSIADESHANQVENDCASNMESNVSKDDESLSNCNNRQSKICINSCNNDNDMNAIVVNHNIDESSNKSLDNKISCENKKETIKLNMNKESFTRVELLELRKQKFGNSCNDEQSRDVSTQPSNSLDTNHSACKSYTRKRRLPSAKEKELNLNNKEESNSNRAERRNKPTDIIERPKRVGRRCSGSYGHRDYDRNSKRKLRSLVVMKIE